MFPWKTFPFTEEIFKMMNMPFPPVQEHINQALSQWDEWGAAFKKGDGADDPAPSSPDTGAPSIKIFETLDFIFIRVPVQEESMLTGLKIFHTSLQVMLKSFPKPDAEQVIRLPSPVRRKGTTAKYRDGILEIRLLKKSEHEMTEVGIDF
ncbi:HSP20-like chaperone [Weizmannia sp. FSL W8-0676]|uniref:HSP20-like chaperone n=1 Tax=Heyndrickxia TaxID=2837504 RepID=UPI0010622367|nr:HSP20-like chaperone [Heyndrickxia coagulans]MBF8418198.1 HSP20-like chaperone [Heyndrickxia coagulans]